MKKCTKMAISSMLTVCLLLSGLPVAPMEVIGATEATDAAIAEIVNPTIVQEDVSLRGEYEKHFLLSDGTYQATVYDEPVHQLVDGAWEEIDNTLSLSQSQSGDTRYTTAHGIVDVSFAHSIADDLVSITQGDFTISWGVQVISDNANSISINAASKTVQLPSAAAEIIPLDLSEIGQEEQKAMAQKSTSSIQYDNALAPGIDLKYTVLPSRVKEDIILNSPQSITSYVVNINAASLTAQLLEDRTVNFLDESDNVIFTMHAPYMYDSAGILSEEISVTLLSKGNGRYVLTMTPDATWLNDASRVYPIVIDPYVSPSSAKSNILDNYVLEGSGVQNNNLDRLYVGNKSGATARTYLKYRAMPYIPVPSRISSAYQRLEITAGTSTTNPISVYTVTEEDWSTGTICWDNMPDATGILQLSVPASTDSENGDLIYYFQCTSAVRAWYTNSTIGKNQNYGIMIRYSDETINDYNAFYSGDCTTESSRPSLSIYYELPSNEDPEIAWPAPGHYTITSPWGYRTFDDELHHGIDISCNELTLVAAISGTISTSYNSSAGYTMTIKKTGSEFQARYYHLKAGGYLVAAGSTVEVGDAIAISGNTGESTGAHLHFQLQYTNDKEKSYNPLDIYHEDDTRSAWTNPNPMFYKVDGIYIPNAYFDYTYVASSYNNTSDTAWRG